MREINLLESVPRPERRIEFGWRTEENKIKAKKFDKDFFDGERINGYGGYHYDGRWRGVVKKMQEIYGINESSAVLDIGCAKGFLLYDLQEIIPGIKVAGIDISEYAINHAMEGYGNYMLKNGYKENTKKLEKIARNKVLPHMILGSAEKLPWPDNTFDVILSINTSHNLSRNNIQQSIKEMNRVSKFKSYKFIQLDSWRNDIEEERMMQWALTAKTMMSEKDWLNFFKESGYNGDYFWTIV